MANSDWQWNEMQRVGTACFFGPMASAMSALSSIVANGHQIVPTVPPPPRFIPYGAFSPVRLEASLVALRPSQTVPGFV
jgi:hypothetical protein